MAVGDKIKIIYEDIEREIVKNDKILKDVIPAKLQEKIIKQVDDEYQLAFPYTEAKRSNMLARLQLYNNQRRDADAVGDNLMFTVFNTIHAALWDDHLGANWEGRGGEGDEDVEENLNALTEYDYDVMEKEQLDYEWNWDAEFFGRGLVLMMDFDRSPGKMCPVPEVLDPTTWIRDPRASSVNGNASGKGAMRFGGYEVGATYYELKNLPSYFNLALLRKDKDIRSLKDAASDARDAAQGRDRSPTKEESLNKYGNYEFNLLNWFTTIKGEKYLVTLGNTRSILVRMVKLDYEDKWPIIDRALYPMSHDWDGVSIPDLTEDKQRMRAVLLNLGLVSAKGDVMPRYLFDRTRIKNKNQLNFRSNKYIEVDGRVDNAIMPVQKSNAHQYIAQIMDVLDVAAQRSTAATELRQGIQSNKDRTATEQNLAAAGGDIRFNMSTRLYGISDRNFWKQWYRQYKKHFKNEIDEKIIRIQGPLAPIWRPLSRDNIVALVDPDVKIESKIISEVKRQKALQSFTGFAAMVMSDPENNRRFIQKKLARLNGLKKEEIDMAFPPTADESQAEDENQMLNNEQMPEPNIRDDHRVHIEIHAKAEQNAYSIAHIRAHKKMMIIKRNRPDLFPPPGAPAFSMPGSKEITPGNKTAAPANSAAPKSSPADDPQ